LFLVIVMSSIFIYISLYGVCHLNKRRNRLSKRQVPIRIELLFVVSLAVLPNANTKCKIAK